MRVNNIFGYDVHDNPVGFSRSNRVVSDIVPSPVKRRTKNAEEFNMSP